MATKKESITVLANKMLKMPDAVFEANMTQHWLEGQTEGADKIIHWLMEEAGKAFTNSKDDVANALRNLADRIKREKIPEFKKAAADHQRVHIDNITHEEE